MQAATRKGSKMLGLINYRLRITLNDTRQFVGQLLAFDKHMNLVVADTEEFRLVKKKRAKEYVAKEAAVVPVTCSSIRLMLPLCLLLPALCIKRQTYLKQRGSGSG